MSISAEAIDDLVDRTFEEVDVNMDGLISFEEYKKMVENHPRILKSLTVDLNVFHQTQSAR